MRTNCVFLHKYMILWNVFRTFTNFDAHAQDNCNKNSCGYVTTITSQMLKKNKKKNKRDSNYRPKNDNCSNLNLLFINWMFAFWQLWIPGNNKVVYRLLHTMLANHFVHNSRCVRYIVVSHTNTRYYFDLAFAGVVWLRYRLAYYSGVWRSYCVCIWDI